MWLGNINVISLLNNNRFFIDFGYSAIEESAFVPNISNSLKITSNLILTSKIYTFSYQKTSPQILGIGFKYFFGTEENLNWITSIQKVDLKGLTDYRLSSITLNISNSYIFNKIEIFYGIGSNFYKQRSYNIYQDIPSKIEGQINYIDINFLIKFDILNIKMNLISSIDNNIISLIIQKSVF